MDSLIIKEVNQDIQKLTSLYKELINVNPQLAHDLLKVDLALMQIILERNKYQKYGSSYAVLGLQGILFQIIHKAERLKNSITDKGNFKYTEDQMIAPLESFKVDLPDKGVVSHLMDLSNYCKLGLSYIYRKLSNAKNR